MFEIQEEGRLLRVKPIAGALQVGDDGWLVMDRVAAVSLADRISQVRANQQIDLEDGEDG